MHTKLRVLVVLVALSVPSSAYSQYIYFDSDGDSTFTASDAMNASGWTSLDIWLDVTKSRDGSPAACTGNGMTAYLISLSVENGNVRWGSFTNHVRSFGEAIGEVLDASSYRNGFRGNPIQPGKYKVASLSVSVLRGAPKLRFAGATSKIHDTTYFESTCVARDGKGRLRLGRDWLDADGVQSFSETSPSHVCVSRSGALFLGGNRLLRPYRLMYQGGFLVINNSQLQPRLDYPYLATRVSSSSLAQEELMDSLDAYSLRLREAGSTDEQIVNDLLSRYRANPLVKSATPTKGNTIGLSFTDGTSIVKGLPRPRRAVSSGERRRIRLEEIKADLDADRVVFITSDFSKTVISSQRVDVVLAIVDKIRRNEELGPTEDKLLPPGVIAQLKSPQRLHYVVAGH